MADNKTKTNYITICGQEQPVRIGDCSEINLTKFLPDYLKETEVYDLIEVFENQLNELYTGNCGYTYSSTTSASDIDIIRYNAPDDDNTISILEKIKRIRDLQDMDLIDVDNIEYLAGNMGYDVDVDRSELGNLATGSTTQCSATDQEKYLRFMIRNLPTWYKIKTTRNAIKIMLYSFGMIGDISQYYTDSYLPDSEGGKWRTSDIDQETYLLSDIPKDFYPTPHFIIWVNLNKSNTNLSWEYDKRNKMINSIQSIRPANTVFRNLGGYISTTKNLKVNVHTRFHSRYLKIPANGDCDYWKI